jgi:acetylornithine deacetylase/succinyl-diaminopimelate desuccinylase-like protein
VLEKLAARQPSYQLTDAPREFLRGLGEDPEDPAGAVERLRRADPRLATMFEPMLGVTFTPTRISASEKVNVIPSRAELKIDCRVPPGLGEQEVREGIAEVLGQEESSPWRIEFTERVPGNGSPIHSQLMETLSTWVSSSDPEAQVVPVVLPGFTDSRHFREAFPECVAYGFFPHRHQPLVQTAPLIHGADERIDVRDLALATELYRDLAERILG